MDYDIIISILLLFFVIDRAGNTVFYARKAGKLLIENKALKDVLLTQLDLHNDKLTLTVDSQVVFTNENVKVIK